jgi:hypothetical protein
MWACSELQQRAERDRSMCWLAQAGRGTSTLRALCNALAAVLQAQLPSGLLLAMLMSAAQAAAPRALPGSLHQKAGHNQVRRGRELRRTAWIKITVRMSQHHGELLWTAWIESTVTAPQGVTPDCLD